MSVESTPINTAHTAQYSLFISAERTRLAQELHNIFVRLKRICHLVRTCLTLCFCLTCRFPTSTSSSSFTLPSTTTLTSLFTSAELTHTALCARIALSSLQQISNFYITRFGFLRVSYFLHHTIRLLHIVKNRDRARRRGPHDTDQFEKIQSFGPFRISYRHPPNYNTLFVPTGLNYELHEIALHFFDSLRIIYVIFISLSVNVESGQV